MMEARHPNIADLPDEAVQALLLSCHVRTALHAKTDAEIADLLLEHVWAGMELLTPQADLVDEAIERLRRRDQGETS